MKLLTFTDSVKEPQAAVLILAQTTLKLVLTGMTAEMMTSLPLYFTTSIISSPLINNTQAARPAAEERLAKQPATRQSAPAQGITL